ncbi:hypothetical protein [Luteimonas sp. SDU101]|uniref:hypothetical protein n=1 Tax=unclassified Luteimonas TaxID=2629088 RepID=UPI003EBFA925
MMLKPALSALALGLLVACGQDVTPPDGGATGGEAARAPATAETAPQGVDPARIDAPPGTAATLIREGGEPGYVADASGAALYYVEGNLDGSQCDQACQQVWPPVMLTRGDSPVAGPGLEQTAVGTLQTPAGDHHLTYHGHPLYRYVGDRGARTTTGHDVQDDWGHWRLAGVDGKPAQPATSPPTTDQPAQ